LLSGWPTMPGAYHFTITATDLGSLCSASRAYTINIIPCHSITLEPERLPDGEKGVYYRESLTATGGKEPYTFSTLEGLPAGMSMSADGVLSGTPLEEGNFSFMVRVSDAVGCGGAWSYTLTIK